MNFLSLASLSNLIYKSWNILNSFSPRLGLRYPSRRPHLSGSEVWPKKVVTHFLIERKYFYSKAKSFFTKRLCLSTFVPIYYFSCITLACISFFLCDCWHIPYILPLRTENTLYVGVSSVINQTGRSNVIANTPGIQL